MNAHGAGRPTVERLLAQAHAAPYEQDFYGLLRALENALPDKPRLGTAARPMDEPVRLGQDAELAFAAATVSSCSAPGAEGPVRVGVRFFGLFGPNGPLPLHLTEFAHGRALHHGDRTLLAFADMFHHRMILLFYRAWAQARPALWLDRDDDARFDMYVGALFGASDSPWWQRDSIDDAAKRRHAGVLARGVPNAEGLEDILRDYFKLPFAIETNVGHWMTIERQDRTRLGMAGSGSVLGAGAVVGTAAWDRQYKFRIHLGPLSWEDYLRFLPGSAGVRAVRDWVRQYLGYSLAWDLVVAVRATEVPPAQADGRCRLGLTAWLGGARDDRPHGDMVLSPEMQLQFQ